MDGILNRGQRRQLYHAAISPARISWVRSRSRYRTRRRFTSLTPLASTISSWVASYRCTMASDIGDDLLFGVTRGSLPMPASSPIDIRSHLFLQHFDTSSVTGAYWSCRAGHGLFSLPLRAGSLLAMAFAALVVRITFPPPPWGARKSFLRGPSTPATGVCWLRRVGVRCPTVAEASCRIPRQLAPGSWCRRPDDESSGSNGCHR